jgi:hypothetical protein
MNEIDENDYVRQTLRQSMPDDLPTVVEQRLQGRLAIFRKRLDMESTTPRGRISQWIGGFTMRQRIAAFGSVGIAAILGLLLLWGGIDGKPASAMEKMAASIREAKSFRSIVTLRVANTEEVDNPSHKGSISIDAVTYWLASGSSRQDILSYGGAMMAGGKFVPVPPWNGPGPENTQISFVGKSTISINHRTKTFSRQSAGREYPASFIRPEDWSTLFHKADRELGVREINGKKTYGFQVDIKKMRSDWSLPGMAEIWIDADSNLPVRARFENENPAGKLLAPAVLTINLEWNIDLDAKLFDLTPPPGYKDIELSGAVLPPPVRRP